MAKTIRLFTTSTTTTTQTIPWASSNMVTEGEVLNKFAAMDVICNVQTITVTGSGGLFVTVQEQFPTVSGLVGTSTYMTTAKNVSSMTATGQYYFTYDNNNQAGAYAAPGTQQNALLGKGGLKQVIFSTIGTVTALSADVIFVFWDK